MREPMREKGNIWPLISVTAGALFVLVGVPLILQHERNQRLAPVDPQVLIGGETVAIHMISAAPSYRWPDSEVPRTAQRLRDCSALAIAAVTFVAQNALANHPPRDVKEIVAGLNDRQLILSEWITDQPGVLRMREGTAHLRYAPYSLSIEVLSVPDDRTDGPAILIRVPDFENTQVGARYFESLTLDGVVYPPPFASISEVIAAGWQPRLFRQTQIPEGERAELEHWASSMMRK